MKLLVCGGRKYGLATQYPNGEWEKTPEQAEKEYNYAIEYLNEVYDEFKDEDPIVAVVQGGAPGADDIAQQWAANNNIPCLTFNAQWDRYGKSAGMIRNKAMLDWGPDRVIAFDGGRGTAHMVRISEKAGVKVEKAHGPDYADF